MAIPDFGALLTALRGLTLANVLVIALLVLIFAPVYFMYRAVNDQGILDRLLSTYKTLDSQPQLGCTLTYVHEHGSPQIWAISAGLAFQGSDRWLLSVTLNHEPDPGELESYCEAIKLVIDRLYPAVGLHQSSSLRRLLLPTP